MIFLRIEGKTPKFSGLAYAAAYCLHLELLKFPSLIEF
jgi:hypothetical protein